MNVAVEDGLKEAEDGLEDIETVFDMLLDAELELGFGNDEELDIPPLKVDDDIAGMLPDVLDVVGMDVDMLLEEIAVEGLNMLVVVIVLLE
jgi:hypothetical protein